LISQLAIQISPQFNIKEKNGNKAYDKREKDNHQIYIKNIYNDTT